MTKLEKFENLVESLSFLPSVGRKSAYRFAYHLILGDPYRASKLAHDITSALKVLTICKTCGGLSENELCEICVDDMRDQSKICIVESPRDILLLEENKIYDGLYFVLKDLGWDSINQLRSNILANKIKEIIFAITPSLSNDSVILYVEDKMKDIDVKFTKIAQGVPTGVSLENVDFISLSRAINLRTSID